VNNTRVCEQFPAHHNTDFVVTGEGTIFILTAKLGIQVTSDVNKRPCIVRNFQPVIPPFHISFNFYVRHKPISVESFMLHSSVRGHTNALDARKRGREKRKEGGVEDTRGET
jgi:hypothetical protein